MATRNTDIDSNETTRRTLLRNIGTAGLAATGGTALASSTAAAHHGVMTIDNGEKVARSGLPGMRHRTWAINRFGYRVAGTARKAGVPITVQLLDSGGRVRKTKTFTPRSRSFDVTVWTWTSRIHTIKFV